MLTQVQLDEYHSQGYIVLDDVFSPQELADCSVEYDSLFTRQQSRSGRLEATWGGDWSSSDQKSTSVLSIHNVQNHAAVFTRMLLEPRLLDAVEQILDSPDILLHHTKAHLKPPGVGSAFPMHQDYHYFPYEKDTPIAVFVHLDDSTPENGGLAVHPGSHLLGPQEDHGGDSGWHYVDQQRFSIDEARPLSVKKGQVAIFSYLLVHGSYANQSERTRRGLLFQLVAAHDRPRSPRLHASPGAGTVLRGCNVHLDADLKRRHLN